MSIFERIRAWWHADLYARFDELEKRALVVVRHVPEQPKPPQRAPRVFDYEHRQ